jgi:hypothetical protein
MSQSDLAASIVEVLSPLIGVPLTLTRRVVDIRIFHFGVIRRVPRGSVGTYALHIQGTCIIGPINRFSVR